MKKIFLFALLFTFVFLVAGKVFAITETERQILIKNIADQIAQLQAKMVELQNLQTSDSASSSRTDNASDKSWCHDFNIILSMDDSGPEVSALQTALIKEGLLTSVSKPTGYFHADTYKAVAAFQKKYGILGTGRVRVGPKTNAKLNQLYGCAKIKVDSGANAGSAPAAGSTDCNFDTDCQHSLKDCGYACSENKCVAKASGKIYPNCSTKQSDGTCSFDFFQCLDGSFVYPDILKNCAFPECAGSSTGTNPPAISIQASNYRRDPTDENGVCSVEIWHNQKNITLCTGSGDWSSNFTTDGGGSETATVQCNKKDLKFTLSCAGPGGTTTKTALFDASAWVITPGHQGLGALCYQNSDCVSGLACTLPKGYGGSLFGPKQCLCPDGTAVGCSFGGGSGSSGGGGSSSCVPSWSCQWSACVNGYQSMAPVDSNNCGLPSTGANIICLALARACVSSQICVTDSECPQLGAGCSPAYCPANKCINGKCSIVNTVNTAFSSCLPSGVASDTVVSVDSGGANKVTVAQKLNSLGASCSNGQLVDNSGKTIKFYNLTGCWGNPPFNYQQILNNQNQAISDLQKSYTVITLTCNPTGTLMP